MVHIRQFSPADFEQVKVIYQQGIDTGNATFETQAKDWKDWDTTMLKVGRLVAVEDDIVVGWAALSAVSGRAVYAGIAESCIYVAPQAQGKGIGHALLSQLVCESESNGFWMLQISVFPENNASVELHIKNGFRILGIREKPGQMNGVWRNTMLMERRSKVVGV